MSTELKLQAGEETEDLLKFILDDLPNETLDEIDVERTQARAHGLASEPITTAVVLTLGPPLVKRVCKLIDKWLEHRREERQMQLVLTAYERSPEIGAALADLAGKHADVAIAYADEK